MKTLKELLTLQATISQEGTLLWEKYQRGETLSEDEIKRTGEIKTELQSVTEEIAGVRDLEDGFAVIARNHADSRRPAANGNPAHRLTPGDGDPNGGRSVPEGSIRHLIQTEQFRRYVQMPGASMGVYSLDPYRYNPYAGRMSRYDDGGKDNPLGPDQLRTLVYQGATANLVVADRLAQIYRGEPITLRVRDLCLNAETGSNAVSFVRENVFTNAAAGTAEASDTAGTGALPESAMTFTVDSAAVKTVGHWIPLTKQLLEDTPAMETYIESRIQEGLREEEEEQILNGAGGNDLTGILQTGSIGALNAAYWAANPLPSAGASGENLDRIRRGRTYLKVTGKATANGVVAHPSDIEKWDMYRDNDDNYLLRTAGPDGTGLRTLWNLPVVESEKIAAGTALIGDFRLSAIFDRMDMSTDVTNSHGVFFVSSILAMKVMERLALAVIRPAAFATVTLV